MQTRGPVDQMYADFAASSDSPCFTEWALGVVGDPEVSAWLDTLPEGKRQPNLVFAAARWHGVLAPGPYAGLRDALLSDDGTIRATILARATQTNEAGRLATLVPAFAMLAGGEPLALLEVGASAGLNLRWDRYAYRAGDFAWGPADSPVRVEFELRGDWPVAFPSRVEVASRRGCDAAPHDPTTREGALTLLAYVWPDQRQRVERLRAALDHAAAVPVEVEREGAAAWLGRQLAKPVPGQATVVFHSLVAQYLSDEETAAFHGHLREAAARATEQAPLAWLRMEPAGKWTEVRLSTWPGGESRLLARAGYHGSPVEPIALKNVSDE